MKFDMPNLANYGIHFYNDDCKENINPKGNSAASEREPEFQKYLGKDCTSYGEGNSSDCEQIRAAAVSIAPIKESEVEHPDRELMQKSAVPCDQCCADETPTKSTKNITDKLQDNPGESIAIDESDTKSSPVESAPEIRKRRGRKRLPREKVIPGKWYCQPCDKNYLSKGGLAQHTIVRHVGNKIHKCNICNKRFGTLLDMEAHRTRHSADKKPHECTFEGCNKRFVHRFDLKRHFTKNHGICAFMCSICEKGFDRQDHLKKHLVSHKNNTVLA